MLNYKVQIKKERGIHNPCIEINIWLDQKYYELGLKDEILKKDLNKLRLNEGEIQVLCRCTTCYICQKVFKNILSTISFPELVVENSENHRLDPCEFVKLFREIKSERKIFIKFRESNNYDDIFNWFDNVYLPFLNSIVTDRVLFARNLVNIKREIKGKLEVERPVLRKL